MAFPPLHPILVNFTAALVPASFISDALGRVLRKQSLISAAWWMLFYAAVITPFTALAGWLWLRQMDGMDMPAMSIHKWLGTGMVLLFVVLACWRWQIHRRSEPPGWMYLLFAAVVVAALVVQGHLGGSMSFGGENPAPSEPRATAASVGRQPATTEWHDHIDVKD